MLQEELERFKSDIDLCQYVESFGYVLDPHYSSSKTKMYRNEADDKLAVSLGNKGYIYVNNHDRSDYGTIIDFHQRRTFDNLAATREALRKWISSPQESLPSKSALKPIQKNTTAARHSYLQYASNNRRFSRFLLQRGLSQKVQSDQRFKNRFTVDDRDNVLFPHINLAGQICGYEIRNHKFYGFSESGDRGIWCSASLPNDLNLVIGESPIDLMSYHALKGSPTNRYISTGGNWSDLAGLVLKKAALMFPGEQITFCQDNDTDGLAMIEFLTQFLSEFPGTFRSDLAPATSKDWNQVLTDKLDRR